MKEYPNLRGSIKEVCHKLPASSHTVVESPLLVFTQALAGHRDRENRLVEVLEGDNWYLQIDDELPKRLTVGEKYYIPVGVYHRVIKGNGELKVLITEM